MADAQVLPRLMHERERAVAIAQRMSDAIGVLEVFPGRENEAREVADDLRMLSDEARRLDESIPEKP